MEGQNNGKKDEVTYFNELSKAAQTFAASLQIVSISLKYIEERVTWMQKLGFLETKQDGRNVADMKIEFGGVQ